MIIWILFKENSQLLFAKTALFKYNIKSKNNIMMHFHMDQKVNIYNFIKFLKKKNKLIKGFIFKFLKIHAKIMIIINK